MPGLVYMMGGMSSGTPIYWRREPDRNCHALMTRAMSERAVFLVVTGDVAHHTRESMKEAGLRFPEEFVELGRIYNLYTASSYGWRARESWVKIFRYNGHR